MGAIVGILLSRLAPFLVTMALNLWTAVWVAVVAVIGIILERGTHIFSKVLVFALDKLLDLAVALLLWLVGKLPDMVGAPPIDMSVFVSVVGFANRWFPVQEMAQALVYWSIIYGAVFLYKTVKFVRGGG